MDSVIDGLNALLNFVDIGIYEYTDTYFERFSAWLIVFYLELKLWGLEFSWSIAQVILDGLDISTMLSSSWASIDSGILNILTFFKIPECLNVVVSAFTTRFVLDLI